MRIKTYCPNCTKEIVIVYEINNKGRIVGLALVGKSVKVTKRKKK